MPSRPFFYRQSADIRITVRPVFLPDQSHPSQRQFVFAYFVRIENVGQLSAQLLTRRWRIHDSVGEDSEVEGEGVVGEQPIMAPGETHEYMSGAILQGPVGSMHGTYEMRREDGTGFKAVIPKFTLQMPRTLH